VDALRRADKALDALPSLASVARTIDFPLIPVLAQMEFRGIRLDVGQLDQMNTEITQELTEVESQMYEMVGMISYRQPKPTSRGTIHEAAVTNGWNQAREDRFSTGQSELDKLRGSHPIIELIERYRELAKLQNTYVAALAEARRRTWANPHDIQPRRGRNRTLSSTDPNLQNIPVRTDMGRRFAMHLCPKRECVCERRLQPIRTSPRGSAGGGRKMINDFNAGTDIHAKTAAEVYKVPLMPSRRRNAVPQKS